MDARIRVAEKEVAALEATLAQLMACNTNFSQSYKKVRGRKTCFVLYWEAREPRGRKHRKLLRRVPSSIGVARLRLMCQAMSYAAAISSAGLPGALWSPCCKPKTVHMPVIDFLPLCGFPQVGSKEAFEERSALRDKLDKAYDKLKARRADEAAIAGDIQVCLPLGSSGVVGLVSRLLGLRDLLYTRFAAWASADW